VRDAFGLKPVRFIKSPAEPRLPAFFVDGLHVASGNIGHQQFYRVGADINDGAADGLHRANKIGNAAAKTKMKIVTFHAALLSARDGFNFPA
jgi:hypothetical protein